MRVIMNPFTEALEARSFGGYLQRPSVPTGLGLVCSGPSAHDWWLSTAWVGVATSGVNRL